MEQIDIVALVGEMIVAGVFVYAWFQERKERQERQRDFDSRMGALTAQYIELIRELWRGERARVPNASGAGVNDGLDG
jgi:alkanesulfonate monooxygenase SsuD/methylene tetrahydromethanopterin reductase-like flavin-dependent oxidoreductase (luciferase family)